MGFFEKNGNANQPPIAMKLGQRSLLAEKVGSYQTQILNPSKSPVRGTKFEPMRKCELFEFDARLKVI